MAKVCNVFNVPPMNKGDYGIEIEVEGENLPMADGKFWSSHQDGSLRGEFPHQSHEYVLTEPIPFEKIHEALTVLNKRFKDNESELNFSFRTSVHVHRNVSKFDEVQLLNLIYLYVLLENPLVGFCGEIRKDNRFCLRVMDADGILDVLGPMFLHGVRELEQHPEDRIRYAALNLASIRKYGSVEFRAMRGTADVGTLMLWTSMIEAMAQYACKPRTTPVTIRETFKKLNAYDFVKEVFGEALAVNLNYADLDFEMNMAHSLTIDLPFFFQRSVYAAPKKEPAKEKKKGFIIMDEHERIIPEPDPVIRADQAFEAFMEQRRAAAQQFLAAIPEEPVRVRPVRRGMPIGQV